MSLFQGWKLLYSYKNKLSNGQIGERYKVEARFKWTGNGGLSKCTKVAELLKTKDINSSCNLHIGVKVYILVK